jgi:hypothetical protein
MWPTLYAGMREGEHFSLLGGFSMGNRYRVQSCHLAFLALVAVGMGLLSTLATSSVVAAGPLDKLDTSLRFVPDDAAIYTANLRGREQIEIIGKSQAWATLKTLPVVQEALKAFHAGMESNDNAKQAKAFWENPETQAAVKLLGEMFSDETFFYTDTSSIDCFELCQAINTSNQMAQLAALESGDLRKLQNDKQQAGRMFQTLADHVDLLKVPVAVFGFRVKDKKLAAEEITKLEGLLNVLSFASPKLSGHVKRKTVNGHEFVTMELDGSMIPWDEFKPEERKKIELRKGDVDKVVEKAKKMTLVFSIGLYKDYLIFAVGPSTDCVARLGTGTALVAREEFKPLEKFADRRLTSVSYISKNMALRLGDNRKSIESWAEGIHDAIPKLPLKDDEKATIQKDAEELFKGIQSFQASAGAMVSFDFLTDRGVEGYGYHFVEYKGAAPKPLELTRHVGGRPILAALAHLKGSVKDYDELAKWVKTGFGYFKKFGLPHMQGGDKEKFEEAEKTFGPLVARLHDITRDQFIPSIGEEGEIAFVLDAKLTEKKLQKDMPEFPKAMPMVEPAFVLRVADGKKFAGSLDAYRLLVNDVIAALHKMSPNDVPEFAIPSAKESKIDGGTLYSLDAPEEAGLSKQFALTFGIAPHIATITITPKHSERLLKETPLTIGGALADANKPSIAAAMFDWAGLVDAATPWVEFAIEQNPPADPKKMSVEQAQTIMKVLKTLQTVTAQTYVENGVIVSHTMVEIHDIEAPKGK